MRGCRCSHFGETSHRAFLGAVLVVAELTPFERMTVETARDIARRLSVVRVVAATSLDATDCRLLLEMLGIPLEVAAQASARAGSLG
jgi:hypothetical protein